MTLWENGDPGSGTQWVTEQSRFLKYFIASCSQSILGRAKLHGIEYST